MARTKRPVEMYLARPWPTVVGGDTGEWWTDFVNIPINTPEDQIAAVAEGVLMEEIEDDDIAFVGVFNIQSLEELDDEDDEFDDTLVGDDTGDDFGEADPILNDGDDDK